MKKDRTILIIVIPAMFLLFMIGLAIFNACMELI